MKILHGLWAVVAFLGWAAWECLTLSERKPDDFENGVDLSGQGR